MLSDHWPLFGLRIRTPRLELRYPSDDDLATLADLTRQPIHDPDFMPFTSTWTRAASPQRERDALRFWWRLRANLDVDDWSLPFMVLDDGEAVGVQDLKGTHFPVTRSVLTGSWLVRRHQGQGVGKEMRAAVLHFAFAGLDAVEAHTSAFEDNPASLGVTRAIGYNANGSQIDDREGRPVRHQRFVLTRTEWEKRQRTDITIDNLEPCVEFLGLVATAT
jgi:RimJ/RimL family protein N-acetyltransferase